MFIQYATTCVTVRYPAVGGVPLDDVLFRSSARDRLPAWASGWGHSPWKYGVRELEPNPIPTRSAVSPDVRLGYTPDRRVSGAGI